jgi:hypothetical protein
VKLISEIFSGKVGVEKMIRCSNEKKKIGYLLCHEWIYKKIEKELKTHGGTIYIPKIPERIISVSDIPGFENREDLVFPEMDVVRIDIWDLRERVFGEDKMIVLASEECNSFPEGWAWVVVDETP